jgi:hypothetical protein
MKTPNAEIDPFTEMQIKENLCKGSFIPSTSHLVTYDMLHWFYS